MHAKEITAKTQRKNICNKKPIEQKSVFNFREHAMEKLGTFNRRVQNERGNQFHHYLILTTERILSDGSFHRLNNLSTIGAYAKNREE